MSVPQRVLIAPSGFKESLSAETVARSIAAGVRRVLPGVQITAVPIADGGEGTAATLAAATGGVLVPVNVTGPVGEPVESHFARLGGSAAGTAVVEMAAAAGLRLVPRTLRDPGATTTYGVGELIRAALDEGLRTIIIGCGDSGTSDGGAGALQALGARVLDSKGRVLPAGGSALIDADRLDLSDLHPAVQEATLIVACNQHNVLCGKKGVARVFGPQKGASPQQVEDLAKAMRQWARVLGRDGLATGVDYRSGPGTGASGGLGAGLAALGAKLVPRFEALIDSGLAGLDLETLMRGTDLVITAEGAIDFQTPNGKVPAVIARRAQLAGVPVLALAGSLGKGAPDVHDIGIDAIASIMTIPMNLEDAVANGEQLLIEATERTMRLLLLGAAVSSSIDARRLVRPSA
ncbi:MULTISPECIES: glycerate kinase family protein [unclassified Arthrobacter]|uniref:glycerate kinase family protein n=1 Tax=unclassified Arthrobacter TaxID=235627 RepID=UPI0006F4BF97|nr:glycerate kinase [Arthrobacter sp. Leaf234]KQO03706.1 glycerate kinase [Arthrobacter sp. Leaf234]